ncbi:MAG: CBS domain-containing protein [Prevotellaceae bacterium]|nr:CBS domain-containing protein [Prevotellaceae bacterium]
MCTLFLYNQFFPYSFTSEVGITLVLLGLCLVVAAWLSACRMSFLSFLQLDMHTPESAIKRTPSAAMSALIKTPELLISTIALLLTLVCTTGICLFSWLCVQLIDLNPHSIVATMIIMGCLLWVTGMLFMVIIPKMIDRKWAWKVCKVSSKLLLLLQTPVKPLAKKLAPCFEIDGITKNGGLTIEDLSQVMEMTDDLKEDKERLEGIIRFGNISVNNVMTSRLDMVAVERHMPFDEVISLFTESGYSRLPVYDTSYDAVCGVIYIKDLVPFLNNPSSFEWQSLMRTAVFVPETRKIDDLLQDFQRLKVHIAIVVDEFGSTLGMVTMEDILEEIVGDISDEYDDDEALFVRHNATTYDFEAKISLNDFFKVTAISPDAFEGFTAEVETLAGLLLEIKGEIPSVQERIVKGDYTFVVQAMDGQRIQKVRLIIKK